MNELPHFAGTILGVRSWDVPLSTLELRPLTGREGWRTDGRPTKARCRTRYLNPHIPPGKKCECGLYAYHPWGRNVEDLESRMVSSGLLSVAGVVEAWGRIELHREGFRAQFARPVAFVVPRDFRGDGFRQLVQLSLNTGAELLDRSVTGSLETWLENRQQTLGPGVLEDLLPTPPREVYPIGVFPAPATPRYVLHPRLERIISVIGAILEVGAKAAVGILILGPSFLVFLLIFVGFYGMIAFWIVKFSLELLGV